MGRSGGGRIRKLSLVIIARGILVTMLHCGTPEPRLSATYIASSVGTSFKLFNTCCLSELRKLGHYINCNRRKYMHMLHVYSSWIVHILTTVIIMYIFISICNLFAVIGIICQRIGLRSVSDALT